jgi:hypothetical protein
VNVSGTLYGYYGDSNDDGVIDKSDIELPGNRDESSYGVYYDFVVKRVTDTLANISTLVTDYENLYDAYELAGMVFFQGWNDLVDGDSVKEYEYNLANFIYSMRVSLSEPSMPFVIGEIGMHGDLTLHAGTSYLWRVQGMRGAQERVAACFTLQNCTNGHNGFPLYQNIPLEYQGNVRRAETAIYVNHSHPCPPADTSCGCPQFHYHNNAATYYRIGKSMGDALVELIEMVI